MWRTPDEAGTWAWNAPLGLGKIPVSRGRKKTTTVPSVSEGSDSESSTSKEFRTKASRAKKPRAYKDRSPSEDEEDSNETTKTTREQKKGSDSRAANKKSRNSKTKESKKKTRKQPKKIAEDSDSSSFNSIHSSDSPGGSSDPSSSSSSTASSDSETSSSEDQRRGRTKKGRRVRKERRSKKGKKRREEKRRSREKGPTLYGRASSDPSTGTEDKVHGHHLTDLKLARKLCPDGMATKDREEFTDLLLDVTHLPGTYRNSNEPEELNEVIGELKGVGDAIISASKSRKTKTQLNSQWNNERRTALLKVSNEENLLDMIDCISSGENPAFKKQTYAIHGFMRRCMYNGNEIETYLHDGLWPRIIEDTFKWNMEFLEQVRRIISKHGMWGG